MARAPIGIGLLGGGYAARVQLKAWRLVPGARVVTIWNRTASRASALGAEFGVDAVKTLEELLTDDRIDAVDIATSVDTHVEYALRVAAAGKHVLCQKPLATTLTEAAEIVDACRTAGVRLMVNENWRWRPWYRVIRQLVDDGAVGRPFYLRIASRSAAAASSSDSSARPFEDQPFLRTLQPLILLEIGPHYFDVARYLFGDPSEVFAQTLKVTPPERVLGEEVATALLLGPNRLAVIELSWASFGYGESVQPDSMVLEGTGGTLRLSPDGALRLCRRDGTVRQIDVDLADYYVRSWAAALRHFTEGLTNDAEFETAGDQNLETLRLVFAAYEFSGEQPRRRSGYPGRGGRLILQETWHLRRLRRRLGRLCG